MKKKYSNFEVYESTVLQNMDNIRQNKVLLTIDNFKNKFKKGKILEIGCLSGKTLKYIKERICVVT